MPQAAKSPYAVKRSLAFMVLRSQRLMSQQLESRFATVGLSVQQHVALQLLDEGLAGGPSDIAKMLNCDTGSSTRLVDQLADKGLIMRRRDGADRRQVSLALTDEGRALAAAARAVSTQYMQSLLEDFEDAEVDVLKDYLSRLVTRLEQPADT